MHRYLGGMFVCTEAEEEKLRYHNLYNAECVMSCHWVPFLLTHLVKLKNGLESVIILILTAFSSSFGFE